MKTFCKIASAVAVAATMGLTGTAAYADDPVVIKAVGT